MLCGIRKKKERWTLVEEEEEDTVDEEEGFLDTGETKEGKTFHWF